MGTSKKGRYLNTAGASRSVSEYALVHSIEGTFMNVESPNPKKFPFRMHSGGHGQENMRLLEKYGIGYKIVKTYPNGVRVGHVDNHKKKIKQSGINQSWFPKEWSKKDVRRAGEHVASLKSNRNAKNGEKMVGVYKGVRIIVVKTNGIIATIYPDSNQKIRKRGKKK